MLTTVKPRLIRTPHYYRQFAFSLGKESPCNFSKFNPLNTDTFYRPLSVPMLESQFPLASSRYKIFLGQPPNLNHAILTFYWHITEEEKDFLLFSSGDCSNLLSIFQCVGLCEAKRWCEAQVCQAHSVDQENLVPQDGEILIDTGKAPH